ncbi:ATP-binding protein [Noviherbaspirillum sp. ST9]|uniref:ATP-binding protein n=1 Tax=Noviherbaspirillum sp. ST9 TaxID=3401606 RepID=UPI003B586D2D
MPAWMSEIVERSDAFMPHGHCYLWIPSLLWLHVLSDTLIGIAYVGISLLLYLLVRTIRLPFSPVFVAFGLFIGLCGLTHFMSVWTVWNPDYFVDGLVKAATAVASVATAVGLVYIRPQVEEVVHTARLSEERRVRLESAHAELEALYRKVTELDELKTQFFANVSHELRTPLALILGPAERMLEDDNLTPAQRRELESISANGKVLLKQVNDLLDVARLEASRMDIRYAHFDIARQCRRIVSQFDVAAAQRGIRLRVDAPDDLPVEADPDMTERVIVNLLSNAFKFTPGEGQIRLDVQAGQDTFTLAVEDSGPGVREDQREAIFERFRQGDGAPAGKSRGTGLGLAIVKDLVVLHGGRISVARAPGGGARFVAELPLFAGAGIAVADMPPEPAAGPQTMLELALLERPSEPRPAATNDASSGLPDVLVVEDNVEMSEFIARCLAGTCNLVTARDGQEGLQRALALRPDLVVTDITMPRMSGDQLVHTMRTYGELDHTPVLLLTAKTDDDVRITLLRNGAQDYLTKPFLPQELRARVGNLLAMKRAGDALRVELASASDNVGELAHALAAKHRQLQTALNATEVAREQAERASQVKSHFLAAISHEMRTPLTSITMNAELLDRHREGQSREAAGAHIERLIRATKQLSTLIEGLLEYTRIESGRSSARMEGVDALRLAREVTETMADTVPEGVQLVLAPPPSGLPPLVSDTRLLRVVLGNLVANALKFTKEGLVTLRLGTDGGAHVFEVHDTGIGIPEADLPRIFLPFEQVEPVQRKSIPGVGFGLALVKQIVEILGGAVEVRSASGAGSTFRVRIPSSGPRTS